MTGHEKAAGVLNTPTTANFKIDTPILSPTEKQFSTQRARAALAGVTLHELDNDHGETVYIVSRWAMTRELADLGAVEAWLDRVTGARNDYLD